MKKLIEELGVARDKMRKIDMPYTCWVAVRDIIDGVLSRAHSSVEVPCGLVEEVEEFAKELGLFNRNMLLKILSHYETKAPKQQDGLRDNFQLLNRVRG